MRDKNDKLTSQIKHKLQNYEVPAGDDLWARIENDLPDVKAAGRFRRYLYVGLAAAAACLVGIVGFRFLSTDQQTVPVVPPLQVVADNSAAPAAKTSVDQSVSLSVQDIREHVRERNSEKVAMARNIEKAVVPVSEPVEKSDADADKSQTEKSEKTAVATASQKEMSGKERLRLVDPDMSFDDNVSSAAGKKATKNSGRGWDFSLAYCNNFASQSSSRSGFSPLMRRANLYGMQTVSVAESAQKAQFQEAYMNMLSKNIEQEQQTTVKYDFPVTYTAAFRYRFNKRWALNAGISYTQLNSEWRSGSDTHFYTTQQKLHYVGVPVSDLTLYALAGGSVEKCVAGEKMTTLFAGKDEPDVSDETTPVAHPWQFSVMAGAGVQFNITKNYGIFAEPTAACFFDNGELANARTDRNVNFQLSLGFRYSY